MNETIKIPNHVAIIMDGNGRWAEARGQIRSKGHEAGSKMLDQLCTYAFQKGVKVMSVYAFSTENFKRSKDEVDFLMNLFVKKFKKYQKKFNAENIKVVFSSHRDGLRSDVLKAMYELEESTKHNERAILNICLNYGGHTEIVDMVNKIIKDNPKEITEATIEEYLYQKLPPIDLLIRTSGELRISNFMLWQMAYSEFYFTDTYFPDFNEQEFDKALLSYNHRDRRFGGLNQKKNN